MQVKWDQNRCIHSGHCVKSLPEVFKIVNGEFTIHTEKANDEKIIAVVNQCPSSALTHE